MQHYAYTAYGMAIGFDEAQALTALLYSGEAFDSRVGLQYLRARWYDPNAGRFNRLDPFSGNLRDPQSLHKYLYTHGDPVNGIDPSGREFTSIGTLAVVAGTVAIQVSALPRAAHLFRAGQNLQDLLLANGYLLGANLEVGNWQDPISAFLNGVGDYLVNQEPRWWETLLPVYGPLRGMIYNYANGHPVWGTIDLGFLIADLFFVGSAFKGVRALANGEGAVMRVIMRTGNVSRLQEIFDIAKQFITTFPKTKIDLTNAGHFLWEIGDNWYHATGDLFRMSVRGYENGAFWVPAWIKKGMVARDFNLYVLSAKEATRLCNALSCQTAMWNAFLRGNYRLVEQSLLYIFDRIAMLNEE